MLSGIAHDPIQRDNETFLLFSDIIMLVDGV